MTMAIMRVTRQAQNQILLLFNLKEVRMRSRSQCSEVARKRRLYVLAMPALIACAIACGEPPGGPAFFTGLRITVETKGLDYPAAFVIQLKGGLNTKRSAQSSGITILDNLPPGTYAVSLDLRGFANCAVTDETRTVTVDRGSLTPVPFAVTCLTVSGVVLVSLSTSGVDRDPSGYLLRMSNGAEIQTVSDGIAPVNGVPGGTHTVELTNVASNCEVDGASSQSLSITVGGMSRDTARTAFKVTCSATEKIAFTRRVSSSQAAIYVAYADGSEAVWVATGTSPAWSPNGTSLAFAWLECDFYYYNFCTKRGVVAQSAGGGNFTVLTRDTLDADPAWRPTDGAVIAFARGGAVYVVDIGGQSEKVLRTGGGFRGAFQPAWSPDAARIAFTCEMDNGWLDICVIAADGTGFARLTSDSSIDSSAAWSPNGKQIAFSTSDEAGGSQIALMSSDGGAITRVTAGRNPAWSRDGTRLLFERPAPQRGIFMITLGSSEVRRLTGDDDHDPTWRP